VAEPVAMRAARGGDGGVGVAATSGGGLAAATPNNQVRVSRFVGIVCHRP
jgi:hypothetical protein